MGRFSPNVPVQDRSGEILANAIGQAFQTFRQGRMMKQQQDRQAKAEQQAREAQDLSLSLQGIQRGTAPMEAAVPMPRMEGGQIAGVTPAPSRYEQLTPGFYRDTQVVERNARQERERALADAVAKAQAPLIAQQTVDPEGFALGRRKTLAEIRNLETPKPPPARNIDPLSREGIDAAVARERRLGQTRAANATATPPRPLSFGAREALAQSLADQAVAAVGGDPVKAQTYMGRPGEYEKAKAAGMTRRHYYAAAERYRRGAETHDKRMESGSSPVDALLQQILKEESGGEQGGASEQQRDWDAAAAQLKTSGQDPVAVLGPRP